jgi:hypothetical protein
MWQRSLPLARIETLAKLSHREWHARVVELKAVLESAPDDLDLANRYWDAISGRFGYDVRDGKRVIDTFRASALKSNEGTAALIHAFRKLFDDSGELPRPSLFDPPLENLLRVVARQSDDKSADDAAWILSFLDNDE